MIWLSKRKIQDHLLSTVAPKERKMFQRVANTAERLIIITATIPYKLYPDLYM